MGLLYLCLRMSHFSVPFEGDGAARKLYASEHKVKGKSVPLQAGTGPEGSRKLRFPDYVTTAQDGGRLSTLRTGCLYPQEKILVLISVRG